MPERDVNFSWHTLIDFTAIFSIPHVDFFFFFRLQRQYMFFVGNLKNTTKYKENKSHLNPTTITLFKTTFPGFKSVGGGAQRHLWIRFVKKCPQGQRVTLNNLTTKCVHTARNRFTAHVWLCHCSRVQRRR